MRILAVDDDPIALRHVRDSLSQAGFSTAVTGDPEEVSHLMAAVQPHLVLLDLMLPRSDGMALMKEILENYEVPVIFLSAYDQEDVVARALDLGASDYVVKPFSATELAARIRAGLRKHSSLDQSEPTDLTFSLEDLHIVYAERRVTVSGMSVKLTATEYALLHQLSVNSGRVLTHTQLLLQVWGYDRLSEHSLVRNVVKRLRGKLGDDAQNPHTSSLSHGSATGCHWAQLRDLGGHCGACVRAEMVGWPVNQLTLLLIASPAITRPS